MNLQRKIGSTLAACGIVMLFFGMGALPAHGAEAPSVALQPSPRPALDPIKSSEGAAIAMGHITGTVIDQRTGAPMPGIAVLVGDTAVTTDANGNYDRWLPVGSYSVALQLGTAQGTPAQGSLTVAVAANTATVQHLSFTSPAPSPAAPAAAPVRAITTAAHTGAAPKSVAAQAPKRLPRTGAGDSSAWLWLAAGMLLLLAGGTVGFAPIVGGRSVLALVRAQAADHAMLQRLLAAPPIDDFLASLLAAHDRRRR